MKDILQDVVKHTHSLGFLDIVKITGSDKTTTLDSMAEDRSVIMQGEITSPVEQFEGTFGMPQLGKLDIHLKCPEYKTNATISVNKQSRNGEDVPVGIHFENSTGDFQNDYRFMNSEIIKTKFRIIQNYSDLFRINSEFQNYSELFWKQKLLRLQLLYYLKS